MSKIAHVCAACGYTAHYQLTNEEPFLISAPTDITFIGGTTYPNARLAVCPKCGTVKITDISKLD
ncbi:hypothetical protein [Heyndrickxia ginsengihumi]|uniref:hypothetical protein n=1 Tax=Heyndrickxia ginsengihumi TaxID=363870 RepID=UPI003D2345EA